MKSNNDILPKSTEEKMSVFFSAIEDIQMGNDGSIVIEWKQNVIHKVKGSHIVDCDEYNINKGKEVHLNPEWDLI